VKTKWEWDFPKHMWDWKDNKWTEHPFHSESVTHQITRCMKKGKSFGDGTPAAKMVEKWDALLFAAHMCQSAAHAPPGTFGDDVSSPERRLQVLTSYQFINERLKEVADPDFAEPSSKSRDSFNCRLIEWCERIHYETTRREDLLRSRTVLEIIFHSMRSHFMCVDLPESDSSDSSEEEMDMGLWTNISDMRRRNFVGQPLYWRLWRFVEKANDAVHARIGEYPDDIEAGYVIGYGKLTRGGKTRRIYRNSTRARDENYSNGVYVGSDFDFADVLECLVETLADYAKFVGGKAEPSDLLKFKWGQLEHGEADVYRLSHGHERPKPPKYTADDYMQFLMDNSHLTIEEIERYSRNGLVKPHHGDENDES